VTGHAPHLVAPQRAAELIGAHVALCATPPELGLEPEMGLPGSAPGSNIAWHQALVKLLDRVKHSRPGSSGLGLLLTASRISTSREHGS